MPEALAKPVYVLHGQDQYLRRQRRREIVGRLLGDADPQLATAAFDGSAELSDVLDELRTVPFLAPRRVVIVDGADKFVSDHGEKLAEYLSDPAPTGSLILVTDSFSAGTALGRAVRKAGEVIRCSAPDRKALPEWIARAAGAREKQIDQDAAALLIECVGGDLARLDSEIEKLSLFVGSRRSISAEDVGAVVVGAAGPVPFALTNAIEARRTPAALDALQKMMTRRGDEFIVLGTIAWHLRRCLAGSTRSRVPRVRVEKDFRRLLAADLALKSGAKPLPTMQMLVTGLCL